MYLLTLALVSEEGVPIQTAHTNYIIFISSSTPSDAYKKKKDR